MVVNEATDMSSNRTSKFEVSDSFKCECCGYKTRQSAINHRHYESDRHLRVQNFSTQVNCKNNKNDFCTDSATQAQPTDSFVDGVTVDQDHYDEDFEEENEAVDDEDEQEYYEERSRDTRTDIMSCSHIGSVLFALSRDKVVITEAKSCTSKSCTWNVPRKDVQPTPLCYMASKLASSSEERNAGTSETGYTTFQSFDPRHTADRKVNLDLTLQHLMELKNVFPNTGMSH
ncbi:Hypothetical predicted protein [Mytilus galloprovincialis]|uniref:Uncharacterized protein n=1 Tax=Mytilus galloprovincialis TaxID=29158 RepID=A0A8B6GHX6_MYTGA|nr:Hypothetical predicted protein [Mytilus galloprovincialis]